MTVTLREWHEGLLEALRVDKALRLSLDRMVNEAIERRGRNPYRDGSK